jgi:5-methyltetrahydrofolate--homocysteine methyltransferase
VNDYIGAFAVTAGGGIDARIAEFEKNHDDYSAIMLKSLADRLAEAFAELMHLRVRQEFWGYEKCDQHNGCSHKSDITRPNPATVEKLTREEYPGIRPAAGYPACPDHTEKDLLWELMKVKEKTGIWLTESKAMVPTAAVSGIYYGHPDSNYFAVGKINRDQVAEYAKRKGMSAQEAHYWLAPNLGYSAE